MRKDSWKHALMSLPLLENQRPRGKVCLFGTKESLKNAFCL